MKIQEKLQTINTLKKKADELMPQKDWDQGFLEKVKLEFTYNSNKIEGNTISYGQTVRLLKDLVTPSNATAGEVLDMINHHMILNIVFKNYHSKDISEESIKELHKALMKNIEQWGDDGLYSPADINDPEKHPLTIATYFHQKFLNELHPFSDGNGRIRLSSLAASGYFAGNPRNNLGDAQLKSIMREIL